MPADADDPTVRVGGIFADVGLHVIGMDSRQGIHRAAHNVIFDARGDDTIVSGRRIIYIGIHSTCWPGVVIGRLDAVFVSAMLVRIFHVAGGEWITDGLAAPLRASWAKVGVCQRRIVAVLMVVMATACAVPQAMPFRCVVGGA